MTQKLNSQAGFDVLAFMRTDEYQADKTMAQLLIDCGSDIRLDKNTDSISNHKHPFAQSAAIRLAHQWKPWQMGYCAKVTTGKYYDLRRVDTNTPGGLGAYEAIDKGFPYGLVKAYCSQMSKYTKQIIANEKNTWFADRIPQSMKSYKDNLDRANGSNLYLSKIFSDATGSSYATLRQVKSTLATMISIHEILAGDEQSKKWRSEFDALNDTFSGIQKQSAKLIGTKFKPPRDSYNLPDGDALRASILSLAKEETGEKTVEIFLADNETHMVKAIVSETTGEQFDAIAFHALISRQDENILHYGWYQKDADSGAELITLIDAETFQKEESTQTVESGKEAAKAQAADDVAAQIEKAKRDAQAQADRMIAEAQKQAAKWR